MSRAIPLIDCAGMSNERWLECRAHGPKGDIPYTVGGSDVATIFGLSPWTTPLELWLIKKGRMKPPQKSNPDQLMMGHLLEPIAAYWYAQKTGNTVYDDTCLYQHPLTAHRVFWSARAAPTIRQRTGRTALSRDITSCSCGSICPLTL